MITILIAMLAPPEPSLLLCCSDDWRMKRLEHRTEPILKLLLRRVGSPFFVAGRAWVPIAHRRRMNPTKPLRFARR